MYELSSPWKKSTLYFPANSLFENLVEGSTSPPSREGSAHYVSKMHSLETIETPKKAKNSLRLELNFLLMQEGTNFIQRLCFFAPFI